MRIHVIAGTTGAGKTAASVRLAQHIDAPVIAIDRFQCFPELATVSGRPTIAELQGTRRIYLDNRRLSQGELGADEAFVRLMKILRLLSGKYSAVILEGGSISICAHMATRAPELLRDVHLKLGPNNPAYRDAVYERVSHMLSAEPSMLRELSLAWQMREQRGFVASICGFDAVLSWCASNRRSIAHLAPSRSELLELIARVTRSHLAYAQTQVRALATLGLAARSRECGQDAVVAA